MPGRRGRNRDYRNKVLALVEEDNPELYEELLVLRSTNPQKYRKTMRKLVEKYYVPKPQKLLSNRAAWYKGQHLMGAEGLDVPYQELRAALKRGNYDEDGALDKLAAAERLGKNRPVIFGMIEEQKKKLESLKQPRPTFPPNQGNLHPDPPHLDKEDES